MTAELETLATRLGVEPARLAALERYDGTQVARLDAAVAGAMARDDHAFEDALGRALGFVPRLLRGTAQRFLERGHHG